MVKFIFFRSLLLFLILAIPNFFFGGNLPIQRAKSFAFQGLHEDELTVSQFLMLKLGAQYRPNNNCYITPQFNIALGGFGNLKEYTDNIFFQMMICGHPREQVFFFQ